MDYVLGYDLGTSYFKAAVVRRDGTVLGVGRVRTPKVTEGAVVTIPPGEFWKRLSECTASALGKAGISATEIAGVSYGSQANSFILFDEHMKPLTDIVVWSTVYTDEVDPRLAAFWGHRDYSQITGQGYTGTGFALAKLLYLEEHDPEMWSRVRHFMSISDYFIYGITGTAVTDAGTSALLGCLDVRKIRFWERGLDILGFSPDLFSPVLPMGEVCGYTASEAEGAVGLPKGIPLFAGGLDHVVAAVGAGLGAIADVSESTGTVLAALAVQKRYAPADTDGSDIPVSIGPALGSGQFSYLAFRDPGAQVIEDYHSRYFPDITIDEMLALVRETVPGASGLRYSDAVLGSTLEEQFVTRQGTDAPTRADQVRAITEHIAYQILKLSRTVSGSGEVRRVVATGGANRSMDLLQVKADMFFAEMVACREKELGTFGAAMVAARGCRWFGEIREVQQAWVAVEQRVQPDYRQHLLYKEWLHDCD